MLVFVSLPHVLSNKFQNLKVKEFVTNKALSQKKSALAHANCSNDVTYFMCSDPLKMEMKSLSDEFLLGENRNKFLE